MHPLNQAAFDNSCSLMQLFHAADQRGAQLLHGSVYGAEKRGPVRGVQSLEFFNVVFATPFHSIPADDVTQPHQLSPKIRVIFGTKSY